MVETEAKPTPELTEEETFKSGLEKIYKQLEQTGRLDPNAFPQQTLDLFKKRGLSLEVIQIMAFKNTANIHLLTTLSGVSQELVIQTTDNLRDYRLINPSQGPTIPAKINFPVNQEIEKSSLAIEKRAQRMRDSKRISELLKLTQPDQPPELETILKLYPRYESLLKRIETLSKDAAALKNNYHAFSQIWLGIKNEFDSAIEQAGEDEHKNRLKAKWDEVAETIKVQQKIIADGLSAIFKKEAETKKSDFEEEYRGLTLEDLEELSSELHARLDHLKHAPSDEEQLVFTPYREYRLKQLWKLEQRIQVIEDFIKHPGKPKEEVKKEAVTPKTVAVEPAHDVEDLLTSILAGAMDIKDLKKEALETPEKEAKTVQEREKIDWITFFRDNKLRVALSGVLLAAGAVGAYFQAKEGPEAGPKIPSIGMTLPDWMKEPSDIYHPPTTPRSDEVKKVLAKSKKRREKKGEKVIYDKITRNDVTEKVMKEALDEPMVKRKINGHDVVFKKTAMNYAQGAWRVLNKHFNIKFTGQGNFFRTNEDQLKQIKTEKGAVGAIDSSHHLIAQAGDYSQAGKKKLTPDGGKIKMVMEAFGWHWGIPGKIELERSDAILDDLKRAGESLWEGEISFEKALGQVMKESKVRDRVHFVFKKSTAEKLPPVEEIEAGFDKLFAKKGK